ncbi:hypothetical protein M413DRAFT_229773 [Hebeloma cylindrosporum]|uniref:Uncharacterized protein n=1 Tax=Hebeloma cylindrosporum TaxID=76867 RepID=A0A0C3CWZ5_HEBCY|nr:hypothetical protein M413DRAFT_229773 [Hebeloma cylindrosporum h7]
MTSYFLVGFTTQRLVPYSSSSRLITACLRASPLPPLPSHTTTMLITFNPPLSDTIHITRPALFPLSQPIVLLFTARLSAHDYRDLVQDKAHVELWSDLPRDNENGWGKLEFSESWNNFALDDSSQSQDIQEKTLNLYVSIPAATSAARRFSFTYRVTYPSGHITWLGSFGQNGSLILEQGEDNMICGLVLREGWREDNTQKSRIFEIPKTISSVEVAKLENPSKFRIWGLNKDGFISHPGNASIFFLIPNGERDSVTLNPTFVLSASPNSSITISSEGRIAASGLGIIVLHMNNIASEADLFIQQIISRSKLDRWNLLSFNSKSNIIALAFPGAQDPRQVVAIPLWSSHDIQLPLNPANCFADKSRRDAIAMAIGAFSRSGIHILDREIDNEVCLGLGPLDATSTDFHVSVFPVYKLPHSSTIICRNWAVGILTSHTRASFSNQSGILPTPPPSPHLRPLPSLSQSLSASKVNNMSPAGSSAAPPDESANDDESFSAISPESLLLATNSPPQENLVSLFTSIFASFGSFFILFIKILLDPILPLGEANFQAKSEDSPFGGLDDSASALEQSFVGGTNADGVPGSMPGDSGTQESMPAEREHVEPSPISSVDVIHSRTQPKTLSRSLRKSEDVFCVELQYDENQKEEPTTATVEILFMPLPGQLPSNQDVDSVHATPQPNPKESLERAVRFDDGSVASSGLREVDVFFHDASTSAGGFLTRKVSCYLLQYQLDVVALKKGKVISISPPVESGV